METEFFSAFSRIYRTKLLPHISRLKEPQSGYLRYRLLQQLDALCLLVPSSIDANPSDVAAWPCEAGDNARLDWLARRSRRSESCRWPP